MKIYPALMILLLCATSLWAEVTTETEYLQRGNRLLTSGDYLKAARAYEQAARLYPASAQALLGLGESYLKLGHNESMTNVELLEKAVQAFKGALRLDPELAEVRCRLGRTYLALHDRDGALGEQQALLKLDRPLAAELAQAIADYRPMQTFRELGSPDKPENGDTNVTIDKNVVLVPVTLSLGSRSVASMLVLDTGASVTTVSSDTAERLGIRLDQAPTGKMQVVGGKLIDARAVRLDTIAVGPHRKHNMILAVVEHNGPAVKFDGLLGMDFLRDLRYHVDFKNQVINWGR